MLTTTARVSWRLNWWWWGWGGLLPPINKTRSEINTMIGVSSLIVGQSYTITDPIDGWTITVSAISSNQLWTSWLWKKTHEYKWRGTINFKGESGTLTQVNVDWINQLLNDQEFFGDWVNFLDGVCSDINSNPDRSVNATYAVANGLVMSPRLILESIVWWDVTLGLSVSFTWWDLASRNINNVQYWDIAASLDIEVDYVMNLNGNSNAGSRIVRAYHMATDTELTATKNRFDNWWISIISGIRDDWTEALWWFKWWIYKNCRIYNTYWNEVFLANNSPLFDTTINWGSLDKVSLQGNAWLTNNIINWGNLVNVIGWKIWISSCIFNENWSLSNCDFQSTTVFGNIFDIDSWVSWIQVVWLWTHRLWYTRIGKVTSLLQVVKSTTNVQNSDFWDWYVHQIDTEWVCNVQNLSYSKTDYPLSWSQWINLICDNSLVTTVIGWIYSAEASISIEAVGSSWSWNIVIVPTFFSNASFTISTNWADIVFRPRNYVGNQFQVSMNWWMKFNLVNWDYIDCKDHFNLLSSSSVDLTCTDIESPASPIFPFPSSLSDPLIWLYVKIKWISFEKNFSFVPNGTSGNGASGSPISIWSSALLLHITYIGILSKDLVFTASTFSVWYSGNNTAYLSAIAMSAIDNNHYEPSGNSVNASGTLANFEKFVFVPNGGDISDWRVQGVIKWFIC